MKATPSSSQSCRALTLFEVLLVVTIVAVLIALLMPALANAKRKAEIISCNGQLKQIGLAYRVWEGDHTNLYPPFVSVTNGGTMELCTNGSRIVLANFLAMSNELSDPIVLRCPADSIQESRNFSTLASSNISYFQNLIATDEHPEWILSGDANLLLNGTPMHSGVTAVSTNNTLSWTSERHRFFGNIGLADGSVIQVTTNGLQEALQNSGPVTNLIATP